MLIAALPLGWMGPAPPVQSHRAVSKVAMMSGKGFGGGEATRDPEPTAYDPADPKGKQQAIHKAESFADYLARRQAGGGAAGGEATRDASATAVATAPAATAVAAPADYAAVKAELVQMMDNPSWDDGSLAPIFIRLAWHSSGTYDPRVGTGGSNGAGMRFELEAADPENAGLQTARAFLEPVRRKFPGISYSDLWVLAAYAGLEHTGGPKIAFRPGRVDHLSESAPTYPREYGKLPAAEKYCTHGTDAAGRPNGWEGLCTHIRDEVFYRMGFGDREIVALLCGGHVYGRCHPTSSGYAGAWVEYPTKWSNEYAGDMIEDEWRLVDHTDTWLDAQGAAELRPAEGRKQFVNQMPRHEGESPDANQMMLLSDMVLAWDPAFRAVLEEYAEDEDLLARDFAAAFKKLTELGCEGVLQPEVAC